MINKIVVTLFLYAISGYVSAQVCPWGAYPGRLDEPQICRPQPNDESTTPQVPRVIWENRWGAIAIGDNSRIGTAVSMRSKHKAEKAAMSRCAANGGGKGCRIEISYYNQCGVIAWGETTAITQGAETIEVASKVALEKCNSKTRNCKIYYADCSLPERVK